MGKKLQTLLLASTMLFHTGRTQEAKQNHPPPENLVPIRASFYASKFEGRRMANGKRFHANVISAASTHFPLGTVVRVTNVKTGKAVTMTITDRGPWRHKFQLDLSPAAFKALGFKLKQGWGWVTVEKGT